MAEEAAFFPQEGSFLLFSQPLEVLRFQSRVFVGFFPLSLFGEVCL